MFEDDFTELTTTNEDIDIFSQETVAEDIEIKHRKFCCSGEVNINNNGLNEQSFVKTNEIYELFRNRNEYNINSLNCHIFLFGKKCHYGTTLLNEMDTLFNLLRKNLLSLYRHAKPSSKSISLSINHTTNNEKLRSDICDALIYIRHFISSILYRIEFEWMLQAIISKLEKWLSIIRLSLKRLVDLPDFIIHNSASKFGNESKQAAYHLFHCHLDIRWLHLTILYLTSTHQQMFSERIVQNSDFNSTNETNLLSDFSHSKQSYEVIENQILLLISELVEISIGVFRKENMKDIKKKSSFPCTCVKELWLMLQFFTEKLSTEDQSKNFWHYFNTIIDNIINKNQNEASKFENCFQLTIPSVYNCDNKYVFAIWLLYHVSTLQGYQINGTYIGFRSNRVQPNFNLLEKSLRYWITTKEYGPTEITLRTIMPFILQLTTIWWEPKTESIAILWEYFHKQMNSSFYIQGSAPDNLAIICKTPKKLLEQIKQRVDVNDDETQNSYSMFLQLLGIHLKRCLEINQVNQWQKMKGRIYPKFSSNKLAEFNETGLYNFISLYLTLAVSTNLEEVGSELHSLLSKMRCPTETNRYTFLICSEFVLLMLYVEKGIQISDKCSSLVSFLSNSNHDKKSKNITTRIIIEGMSNILENSVSLELGEHILIDAWLFQYLNNVPLQDIVCVFEMFSELISKLRILYSQKICSFDEFGFKKVTENIFKHLFPFIKQCLDTVEVPSEIADVAVLITLLSLDDPETAKQYSIAFVDLFRCFAMSATFNYNIKIQYLSKLLNEDGVIDVLSAQLENYQYIIVQIWIHNFLFCNENQFQDQQSLTCIITKLPEVLDFLSDTSILLDAPNPIFQFFSILGLAFSESDDFNFKNKLKTKIVLFLGEIDKKILFITKINPPDNNTVQRMYSLAAVLYFHCAAMIYTRNNASCLFHIITNQILLPPTLFMENKKLNPLYVKAIRKTWHLFFTGVAKIEYTFDSYIEKVLKDMVVQYVPYFMNKLGCGGNQPFLKIFEEPYDNNLAIFVLNKISATYITCKGKIAHKFSGIALSIISEITAKIKTCSTKLATLIKATFEHLFEQLMFLDDTSLSRKIASDIFNTVLTSTHFQECNEEIQTHILEAIIAISNKHLAFSTHYFMQFLIYLSIRCPNIVQKSLPQIRQQILTVEHMRGVGYDTKLRSALDNVEGAVQANLKDIET